MRAPWFFALLLGCDDKLPVLPPGADTDGEEDTDPGGGGGGGGGTDDLTPRGGDLVVSEVMFTSEDCPGPDGQFIELYNASGRDLDLEGVLISGAAGNVTLPSSLLLPGAWYVLRPATACGTLPPANATWSDLSLTIGPSSSLEVTRGTTIIDRVPTAEWVDRPGKSHTLTAARLSALANDTVVNWCHSSTPTAGLDLASPGQPNETCPPYVPDVSDTLDEIAPGALRVSEVMRAPEGCDGLPGQYLELANVGSRTIDTTGLRISDGVTTVDIDANVLIGPGAAAWIGAGSGVRHCFEGAAIPDAQWLGDLRFEPGETVVIGFGDPFVPLDQVDPGPGPDRPGVARQWTDWQTTSQPRPTTWCNSQVIIAGFPDRGSPGATNSVCPGEAGYQRMTAPNLLPGDLIITEAMFNPDGCDDYRAEYFEVFNTTGLDLNVQDLTIVIDGGSDTLSRVYEVDADTWALAEIVSGAGVFASCYIGLTHDFGFQLPRMRDEGATIELYSSAGLIDAAYLTDQAWQPGSALQLDVNSVDHLTNDDPASWCHATNTFTGSFGDKGSPKQPNHVCEDAGTDTGGGGGTGGAAVIRHSTGSPPGCYGLAYAALYSADKMDDTGSVLRIQSTAGTLDQVSAAGWSGISPGVALQLDPDMLDATLNDDPAAWCPATAVFLGATNDRGTPTLPNVQCP
jgi:hypothetical protein